MPTIEETLTRANNVLAVLESLIAGDAAETPLPDSNVSYAIPIPTFNETTGEWTLTQNTTDTDGLYKGLYQLAISTGCSQLTIVNHNIVTPDDSILARYAPCGGSLTNVSSVSSLNGLEISKVEFRSKNPFTVTLKLSAGDYRLWEWDFTTMGQGEWYPDTADNSNPSDDGFLVPGSGWKIANFNTGQRGEVAMLFEPTWEIIAVAIKTSAPASDFNGRSFQVRPTAGSLVGNSVLPFSTALGPGYNHCRDGLLSIKGYNEVAIALQTANQTSARYLEKVAILFNANAAKIDQHSHLTNDNILCN